MTAPSLSRRSLMQGAAMAGLAGAATQADAAIPKSRAPAANGAVAWLDTKPPALPKPQTLGIAWPRGKVKRSEALTVVGPAGPVPTQSWPLAYWPDGSVKWTGLALSTDLPPADSYRVTPGKSPAHANPVQVRESADSIEITTGNRSWTIGKSGQALIRAARIDQRQILGELRLVALRQSGPDNEETGARQRERAIGRIDKVTIEQTGPIRAVVKLEGVHVGPTRSWLPFVLRIEIHAGASQARLVHSFIYDGDATVDFLAGLGLEASVPLRARAYDRHVRIATDGGGYWAEAVQPLTGLRREPGKDFRDAQIAGKACPPLETMRPEVGNRLSLIPTWGDFTLSQINSDGFTLRKRTAPGHGWIGAGGGTRAAGLAYVGDPQGGVAFGVEDFWRRAPGRLDIAGANTPQASVTAWLLSPDAPAQDMRPYHDGLGMVTHPQEREGLEITYEDYEKGWDTPAGIARTNILNLHVLDSTPPAQTLADLATQTLAPPRLVAQAQTLLDAGVFGDWSLVDRSTPARARIEDQLDYQAAFYMREVEQRRWYGFWDHGDVMHTYDRDRKNWRYDIGGFAWANSELSPDLWLWYAYLRSGRADIFRLAEAMTRHTGEVDVYHIGPYRGLGTRHGVQHWSDSSKQPRVSQVAYRRIFYYLTADERVGDLMAELVDSEQGLQRVHIERKLPADQQVQRPVGIVQASFGTSWSSFLAAWLTQWERTGDPKWRDRIVAGMRSLTKLKRRWLAGGAAFNLATGEFEGPGDKISLSHLNAVFGAVEIHAELLELVDEPEYKQAWLEYCRWYNAPAEEWQAQLGTGPRGRNLIDAHSRLTAYYAKQNNDPVMAKRAWSEFFGGEGRNTMLVPLEGTKVSGPGVIHPLEEDPRISTNGASQWGLAAIQNLALIGQYLPDIPAGR